jgi:glycosyltransferase involved in cell wall biosynthesis
MPNPIVSVIIPNYNYGRYLSEALESVFNQTYKELEIIVVNNGSTDNSMEILDSFGEKITVINQQNLGQATARNVGIAQASGKLLALLDADDIWLPDKIESQVSLITDSVQLVYCGIHFVDSNASVISRSVFPMYKNDCLEFFENKPWRAIVVGGESTALFSRKLYEDVGGFNVNLSTASGWDFFRKCAAKTHFEFSNNAQVLYRQHTENISRKRGLIYWNMVKSGYLCTRDQIQARRFKAALLFIFRASCTLIKSVLGEILKSRINRSMSAN